MSINNAVMGSVKNHPFVELLYNRLLSDFDGTEDPYFSGPGITTTLLKEKGLADNSLIPLRDPLSLIVGIYC